MHIMKRRLTTFALLAIGALSLAGCYEHVVKESGIGPSRQPVYEPNVPLESDKNPLKRSKKFSSTDMPGPTAASLSKKPAPSRFDDS